MKKFFNRLGFHKADELELLVSIQSARYTYAYINIFLVIWQIVDMLWGQGFNPILSILISSQLVLFAGLHIYFRKKLGLEEKCDDEE